jgi:hypothetical protein
VPHAYFLSGESDNIIKSILDTVPVELQNTPPEAIETNMTIVTEPQMPSTPPSPPVNEEQPTGEGTSMRLLRTGHQEGRAEVRASKPRYTVATPDNLASADKAWQSFDNNDPL